MSDQKDWRDLLRDIIAYTPQRRNLAQVLGVHPQTLVRWAAGISEPRAEYIDILLHHLPDIVGAQELQRAVANAYPKFNVAEYQHEEEIQEIPSAFYRRIHHTYVSQAVFLRNTSVALLVLQQVLKHVDPQRTGMVAFLVQCVPPAPGQPQVVRSLRTILARGTGLWEQNIDGYSTEKQMQLFGAESLCGMALQSGHPIIVSNLEERNAQFPTYPIEETQSTITIPILMGDHAAGCLCLVSTQEYYFSQARLDVLNGYTEVLALAFNKEEYYPLTQIALGILPSQEKQAPILASIPRRTLERLRYSYKHSLGWTLQQAEQQAWNEVEAILLQIM